MKKKKNITVVRRCNSLRITIVGRKLKEYQKKQAKEDLKKKKKNSDFFF